MLPNAVSVGFSEQCVYRIAKPSFADRLWIDDEELGASEDESFWTWQPQYYAGRVRAELRSSRSELLVPYYLDLGTDDNKLGANVFKSYVEYIAERIPELLLGTEPATHAFSGRSDDPSVWLRYVRLVMYATSLERSIRVVAFQPIQRIRRVRRLVKLHQVYRIDTYGLLQLAGKPTLLEGSDRMEHGGSSVTESIDVPHEEPTFDNPANRLLLNQLKRLVRVTDELAEVMEHHVAAVSDTETRLDTRAPRRIEQLKSLRRRIRRLQELELFRELSPMQASSDGLVAIASHPEYAHAYAIAERMLRQGIDSEGGDEWHYLGPTWRIYESWCFCALASALELQLPEFEWELKSHSSGTRAFTGSRNDEKIGLCFQLPCRHSAISVERYFSISQMRVPDLILEYQNGVERQFIVLDAKYRVTKPNLLDAMASAHIYKDSIKYADVGSVGSYLLAPHVDHVHQLASRDFHRKYGVGCLALGEEAHAQKIVLMAMQLLGYENGQDATDIAKG